MATLKHWIGAQLPERFKTWLWRATDADYRRRFAAQRDAIRTRRTGWREAMSIIWPQANGRVIAGPFQGLPYLRTGGDMVFPQKLIGTYEQELGGIIEIICQTPYDTVIDVGAAEGYYACGLAHRMPKVQIIAFEADAPTRELLRRLVNLAGVESRVQILGFCTPSMLTAALASGTRCLVVCDVEGAEWELLDLEAIPALEGTDLLVEVHDDIRPGISALLCQRFASSHTVRSVLPRSRTRKDIPAGLVIEESQGLQAMDEARGEGNGWLWMRRRSEVNRREPTDSHVRDSAANDSPRSR